MIPDDVDVDVVDDDVVVDVDDVADHDIEIAQNGDVSLRFQQLRSHSKCRLF